MILCEGNNIDFDRTKLEKLKEILERLKKEEEDFRKTDIYEEIAEVDRSDRLPKEKQIMTLCQQLEKLLMENLSKFQISLRFL